ncbi:hypothetical protein V8J88_09025 [Massilia sp. W12]|uniref:hypothetical protein n=1 Tax=Massilia sp. W12 TaxID=3126507 RepID=UPI0030D1A7E5
MSANDDVYGSLNGLLQQGGGNSISVPHDFFSGLISDVINFYLLGITLQLGPDASLHVDPASRNLVLQTSSGVNLKLQAQSDGASVTLSSTQYPDASIVAHFKKTGAGVDLELSASMGESLAWQLQAVWPQMLNWNPANQLGLKQGELTLKREAGGDVNFSGTGCISYSGNDFSHAALRLQYKDGACGILFGIEVDSWTPGNIWPPLQILRLNHTGLVFATKEAPSSTLSDLQLLSAQQVPALGADFDIKPGVAFFSSLSLSDSMPALSRFLGDGMELDLFASFERDGGALKLLAILKDRFSAHSTNIFEFDGFSLEWDNPASAGGTLSASASGHFHPDPSINIELDLSGTLQAASGDVTLKLSLKDWPQAFGIPTLTINECEADLDLSAQGGGVTIGFGGDITLQNPQQPQYCFDVGFECEVVDFEAPNGVAVWTKAQNAPLTLSNLLEAAFMLDCSPAALRQAGQGAMADVMQFVDNLIQVQDFEFWFVEGAQLVSVGQHGPYPMGFGLQADFTLLGEGVKLSIVLQEKASASAGFKGYLLLQQPMCLGSVLKISDWNQQSNAPGSSGPKLALALTPGGETVPGINNGNPVRFYTSCYLSLLDVFQADTQGMLDEQGVLQFDAKVNAGASAGTCGTWGDDSLHFSWNPKSQDCSAAFSFDFGWQNVEIPSFTVFGVTLTPAIPLPDLKAAAGMNLAASLSEFVVKGYFDFQLYGADLHLGSQSQPCTLIDINLSQAAGSLQHVADSLLAALKQQFGQLLQAALHDLQSFVNWVKAAWAWLGNNVNALAQILKDFFGQIGEAIAKFLQFMGAAAAQVKAALLALGYALADIEQWLENAYTCAIEAAADLL